MFAVGGLKEKGFRDSSAREERQRKREGREGGREGAGKKRDGGENAKNDWLTL